MSLSSNKELPNKKAQDWTQSLLNSTRALKKLTPMFLILFRKIQREGMLLNSIYEAHTTLMLKPDKDKTKEKMID
jgi:hypothetical protein